MVNDDYDEKLPPEPCEGSCITGERWCSECGCFRSHVRILAICWECCECGTFWIPKSTLSQRESDDYNKL